MDPRRGGTTPRRIAVGQESRNPAGLAGGFLVFLFLGMLTHRRHRRLRVILAVFVFWPPFSLGAVMSLRHAVS